LTQLAYTGLAANLPVVDFGRWFFAEHRCPQMARKNFSIDVPEHSTDAFTSSSSEVRPPRCLCWSVTRHSPLTEGTTGSSSYCKRRRNTDSTFQQSCRHLGFWKTVAISLVFDRSWSKLLKTLGLQCETYRWHRKCIFVKIQDGGHRHLEFWKTVAISLLFD